MSGTHFYLALPSSASYSTFPDNTTTSYRVKLPQTIDLNGSWEVGLYSISYPHTWYNLQNEDSHIYSSADGYIFLTSIVDYGYYETMNDLVKSVNAKLKKDNKNDNIKLKYNARTDKVTVHLKNGHQLVVKGRFTIILGFGGKETKIIKTTVSPFASDLHGSMTIYVYCDIAEPQIVGDTNAKLIRSVPVEGKMGDVVTKTFTNIQYVPVQTKSFEDIEILLREDAGNPVPFERGKVLVTLHFRQKSSPYFA
jgi:hypothetical protein